MELIALLCAQCGAPLEAPTNASFITCRHCSCHLAIKHSESATWSERLDAIQTQTAKLATDVKRLMLERELERIDRDWEREREPLMRRSKSGRVSEPTDSGIFFVGFIALVFTAVILYCIYLFQELRSDPRVGRSNFDLFLIAIWGVPIFVIWSAVFRMRRDFKTYLDLEFAYRRRRAAALSRFESGNSNDESQPVDPAITSAPA